MGVAGTSVLIRPKDHHCWSSDNSDQELVVLLESEDDPLYRNTSSATIDAVLFPSLSSTPIVAKTLILLICLFTHRSVLNNCQITLNSATDDVLCARILRASWKRQYPVLLVYNPSIQLP